MSLPYFKLLRDLFLSDAFNSIIVEMNLVSDCEATVTELNEVLNDNVTKYEVWICQRVL